MNYTQPEAPTHRNQSTHYTQPEVYEYISHVTDDPIVEWKICEVSGTKFPVTQKDLEFYEKVSPVFNDKKYLIPTPRLCPEERQRRRLMFRNERKLYRRKCDATGEMMVSIYSPDKIFPVYDQKIRWGDKRTPPLEEFNGSFGMVFGSLLSQTPKLGLVIENSENSDFCNCCQNASDSYLCFGSSGGIGNMYCSTIAMNCQCCCDIFVCLQCEHCYECVETNFCYECFYCAGCNKSSYLLNCVNCSNCKHCVGCDSLQGKEYCIDNKQLTKEEYFMKLKSVRFGYMNPEIVRNMTMVGSEKSYGNHMWNSKNAIFCFDANKQHDAKYVVDAGTGKSVYDCSDIRPPLEFSYETQRSGGSRLYGCSSVMECSDVYFSIECYNSSQLFGCVGLRNKSYCIFNKQYAKEEYETLVPKIIEQMQTEGTRGEFFDPSLSPFGYNETVAQEYYPLTRQEALKRGYKRQDNNYDPVVPTGVETLTGDQIPTDPKNVDQSILKKIFVCEVSGRPYRIIKQELVFYQKHNLPLPRKHPDVRHEERMKKRPGRTLYLRKCDKTGEEMVSVYPPAGRAGPPEYKGKVYSEKAYRKEVYG